MWKLFETPPRLFHQFLELVAESRIVFHFLTGPELSSGKLTVLLDRPPPQDADLRFGGFGKTLDSLDALGSHIGGDDSMPYLVEDPLSVDRDLSHRRGPWFCFQDRCVVWLSRTYPIQDALSESISESPIIFGFGSTQHPPELIDFSLRLSEIWVRVFDGESFARWVPK
jgi:hypothetical protein